MDLFDQTLALTFCAATTVLIISAIKLNKKHYSILTSRRPIIIGLSIAAAFAIGLWVLFSQLFYQDRIPYSFMILALPVGFSLYLVAVSFTYPKRLILSIASVATATILLLLSVNSYYHYFPTLAAFFQRDTTAIELNPLVTKDSNPSSLVLEQYYQAPQELPTHGQLLPLNIPASSAFSPRQGRIYLPPALHNNTQLKLPVIVLLAGYPGSPLHWEQAGILSIMDTFAAAHKGLAPIVAIVDFTGVADSDTECVDSARGNAETYLAKDVPTFLKQHYQVQTDPSGWSIGGYSAGGTCGPLIALRNPTIYQNFINISGDAMPSVGNETKTLTTLFNGSSSQQLAHTPISLLKKGNPLYAKISGWYFYAKQDDGAMVQRMQDQYSAAKKAGLSVSIKGVDGHHGFLVWKQGYVEGLPWISHQMGLTNL